MIAFVLHRTTVDKATLKIQVHNFELEKAKAELDRQKTEQKAKVAVAQTHRGEALVHLQTLTNDYGKVLKCLEGLENEASALRTNREGQLVARQPVLLDAAKRFYERNLGAMPQQRSLIFSKLESARILARQLVDAEGSTFEPSEDFMSNIQAGMTWAGLEMVKIQNARVDLVGLIVDGQRRLPPQGWNGQFMTLDAALAGYDAALRRRMRPNE